MKSQWIILNRLGKVVDSTTFPKRPKDANKLIENNPYTPWYKQDEHIHIANNHINGIHALGTEDEIKIVLDYCLAHEDLIINHFNSKEDNILLIDVLKLLIVIQPS
ncbi:hypothetical protein H0W80_00650 [Candidatus Saccharibacteria bacterium]|nr:hypothetical protein [Candidatus Saccharibacteria bacterium]